MRSGRCLRAPPGSAFAPRFGGWVWGGCGRRQPALGACSLSPGRGGLVPPLQEPRNGHFIGDVRAYVGIRAQHRAPGAFSPATTLPRSSHPPCQPGRGGGQREGGRRKGKEKQPPLFAARETSPGAPKVSEGEGEGKRPAAGTEPRGRGGPAGEEDPPQTPFIFIFLFIFFFWD